jgi:hypothetical protein
LTFHPKNDPKEGIRHEEIYRGTDWYAVIRLRETERGKKQSGRKESMNISEWLDKKEADGIDVSQITLPEGAFYDEAPDETIFFKEINPDGMLSIADHPFSTVERFGHWYYCRGRDKAISDHSSGMEWRFLTKDRNLSVKTAKSHIE